MSLLITDAGIAASIRAGDLGISYKITEISIGTEGYTPSADQTKLRNEIQRKAITRGEIAELGQLHFETTWDGDEVFEGKELGYWLDDGTLFAVDSRDGEVITYKRKDTVVTESCELTLAASTIENITVEIIGTQRATEEQAGIAKIATHEQINEGVDDTVFITPKKLKDNPMPLILKRFNFRPDDLLMSVLPIAHPTRPEWILPASASKVKFINIETRIITSEHVNIGFIVYCHDSESGGVTHPSDYVTLSFSVPSLIDAPFGVYNNFVVPITIENGDTPKRLSFGTSSRGAHPTVVSKFDVVITSGWESPS